jgi:hypothetical protein
MIYLEEVLARPGEGQKPLREQEYWLLDLLDFSENWRPHFLVQQYRACWSDVDQCMMVGGTGDGTDIARTLEEAKQKYEARRAILVRQGFIESDMKL